MVAEDSPESLPSGWTVQFKVLKSGRKVTVYTNMDTGKRFFSKDDFIRFINAGIGCSSEPQTSNRHASLQAEMTSFQPLNGKDQLPEWLPKGWKVEVRTRKSGTLIGREYKSYIDPSNGSKFYSKPEVIRYLKTVRRKSCIANDVKSVKGNIFKKKSGISMLSAGEVVVQKCKEEDLPSGWIKEIKIRKNSNGIRKDPFYKDPVSGYIFRSKKDALRYIETGEISRSAIRPKESCNNAPELVKVEIASSSAPKRQKLKHPASRRQLFGGKTESEMSNLEPLKTEGSNGLSAKTVSPEAKVTFASRHETVQGMHPLNNVIQECVETKEKCSPRRSPPQKVEGSREGRDRGSPPSDAGLSTKSRGKKDLAKNGPVSPPTPDTLQDKNFLQTAMEKTSTRETRATSRKSKDKKVHNGPEKSKGAKVLAENGSVLTPIPETLNTVTEKSSVGDTQVNSRKSMDKKVHNLPPRSSKRLAGNEPDLVVNLELGERALRNAIRKSVKTEAIQDSVMTSDGLVDNTFAQLEIRTETEPAGNASTDTRKGDPSNKGVVPLDERVAQEEIHQKLETERVHDNPEPQLSFLFGSDPCLEFAFKTLIGELPVDDTSVNGPILTRASDSLQHENLLDSGMKNSSTGKGFVSKSKAMNKKELNLQRRSSKRLAGINSELPVNPMANERAHQDASIKPSQKGTISETDLLDKANERLGNTPDIELNNRLSTKTDTSIPQPSGKSEVSLEDLAAAPQEQPQMRETSTELEKPHGTENTELKKPEPAPQIHESGKEKLGESDPDIPFSIADYWSDPCLDFAFKTLTGVIPIEDTLVQGCFQEQVHVPDSCKNGNMALPDFGSSSLFQTDISSQFDTPEKSAPSLHLAGTSSFLPPPNVSLSSCSGIHSQQQPSLEGDKDLHQKVKS